jgi:hypothetical protein
MERKKNIQLNTSFWSLYISYMNKEKSELLIRVPGCFWLNQEEKYI